VVILRSSIITRLCGKSKGVPLDYSSYISLPYLAPKKKKFLLANNFLARPLDHSIAAGTIRSPVFRSNASITSGRSGVSSRTANTGGMATTDRSRARRERTFVGSECAVCEEPLEHTLRGERILQFSCAHVSHEACFYEFIREFESQYCPSCNAPLHLDTSRGGNVLDIGKLVQSSQPAPNLTMSADGQTLTRPAGGTEKISNMVRSHSISDTRSQHTSTTAATPWDNQTVRPLSRESNQRQQAQANGRESVARSSMRDSREPSVSDRYGPSSRHVRSDSEATGVASSGGYPETTQSGPQRRHDYDVQAMETTPSSPRGVARNPIPAPLVTVRSEFPTINRSRQQQTLTCLVTIEVADNKWRPDPEDLGAAPPLPSVNARIDEAFAHPASPARGPAPRFYPYESREVLEEMTESLRNRVDNWHGLDFSRLVINHDWFRRVDQW
jgi:hypothetical protein